MIDTPAQGTRYSRTRIIATACALVLGLLASAAFTPSQARAAAWDDVIPEVKARADALLETASRQGTRDVDALSFAITEAEAQHAAEMRALHFCAIAGRMVGLEDDITRLERIDYIAPTEDASPAEIDWMILDALSLLAWVGAAEELNGMNIADKRRAWNLSCVGAYGIPERTAFRGDGPPTEPVELFRIDLEGGPGGRADWWIGTLDPAATTSTDRQVEISGDGYNASFQGRISLDCTKERLVWLSAERRDLVDAAASDALPREVTMNALKVYCRFM